MTEHPKAAPDSASITVTNVAGIDCAEVSIEPGLTTLEGANATNRTSLLCALNEVLGGTMGSVRRGADGEGTIELAIDDETHTRTLVERDDQVVREGDPYLENATVVDLYASLLEDNRIRRLVATADKDEIDDDLADHLMAPVDVESIQAEIENLQDLLRSVEQQLEKVDAAKAEIPDLVARRDSLRDTIESITNTISTKRSQLVESGAGGTADGDLDLLDELHDAREELQETEQTISLEKEKREETRKDLAEQREERAQVEAEIEAVTSPDAATVDALADRTERVDTIATALADAARMVRLFRSDDHQTSLPDDVRVDHDHVTDPSTSDDDRAECPLCWRAIDRETLLERGSELRELADEYRTEAERLEEKRAELRSRRSELEELRDRRESIESDISRLKERLEDSTRHIESLEANRKDLQTTIDDLEERIDRSQERRGHEAQQFVDEIADLQAELTATEAELDRVEEAIADHEELIGREDDLRDEKTSLEEAIRERRDAVNDRERRVQEAVSTHASALIDRLEYDRIADVRIERHPTDNPYLLSTFELVIERRVDGDVLEERDITTLSGSERALVGLVVALAGYVAHDIAEEVPFLLLDAIEQFDGVRIDRLVTYVREELDVEYVVAALLPEDAAALTVKRSQIEADAFEP